MRLALFGDPVAHSRSPAIHEAALRAVGMEGGYEARRCDTAGLRDGCDEIRRGHLDGANVTTPLKVAAAGLCDRTSTTAGRAGAVNTLYLDEGDLVGDNTDASGLRSLIGRLPTLPIVVLGTGATAAAALLAAEGKVVTVLGRDQARAAALVGALGIEATVAGWAPPLPGQIVINATTLGMDREPLPVGFLDGQEALIDLPYGDEPTAATSQARRLGLTVFDGIDVLVAQAAASFQLWTGMEPPVHVMERAARG